MVWSDFKVEYSQTLLGYLWWLLDPLMYTLVYVFLVRVVFSRGDALYPVFVLSALVPWKLVTSTMGGAVNSIRGRLSLSRSARIPQLIFPLADSVGSLIRFAGGLVLVVGATLIYGLAPGWHLFALVPVVLLTFLFTAGLGVVIADLAVFFGDVRNILQFGLRLWFYLSPGLYSLESVPEQFRFFYTVNPLTYVFDLYRTVLLQRSLPEWSSILILLAYVVPIWALGLWRLGRNEKRYLKVSPE